MRATLNGIKVAYTDEGKGPTLFFVHGFPLNRETWSKQVEAFRPTHRIIAPDLRGLGETEATDAPASMSRCAEDLFVLMQHLELGPVTLVGHSMGGYVALAFAKAYPQMLQRLVLVGTRSGADTAEGTAARRELAEKVTKEGTAILVEAMAPKMLSAQNQNPGMAAAVRSFMLPSSPKGVVGALLGMAERPDMSTYLEQIRVPTLVVTGTDDTIIPPSESKALAKAIPESQLSLIEGGGHLVAFESAEAFNEVLRVWLAKGAGQ